MSRSTDRWDAEPPPRWDLRLVPAAIACWVGALVGLSSSGALIGWSAVVAVAAGCAVVAVGGRRVTAGAVAVVALLVGGMGSAALHWVSAATDPLVAHGQSGSWAVLEIRIGSDPQPVAGFTSSDDSEPADSPARNRWRIVGTAVTATVAGRQWTPVVGVTVFADGSQWPDLVPGEQIRVGGLLGPDQLSVLPAVVLRARDPPVPIKAPPWWQQAAAQVRDRLVDSASGLAKDPRALLPGLVVGDTSGIDDALEADAKATGLTHLLAVSGSHFAIICGAVVLGFRRIGPRIAAAAGMLTLLGLVVLVGPEPSVLRAAVMGAIAIAALVLRRGRSALPALAAAVILLLLFQPELALSAGFALSVQATAGLIVLAPVWSQGLRRRGWPAGWSDVITVPVAAGLVTMPVIASLSGSVSLAGVPANILVAPVVAPALVLGLIAALLGPWWPAAARVVAGADEPLLAWIAQVAHRLARWPSATLPWPATLPGVFLLAGLALGLLLALRHQRVRAVAVAASVGAFVVLVPAQVVPVGWPPPGWLLTGCEVGQGDAMVLATDDPGTAVVVDTGPDPPLVDACLDRLGITTVPLVVVTHLHADHVDGLAGVLNGRAVGGIVVGPDRSSAGAWRTLSSLAAEHGVAVVTMEPGRRWTSGGLELTALGPAKSFTGTASDANNDSLVLMARRSGVRMLLVGDIETEAQQQLLRSGADLRAEVLKQPHHGSAKVLREFVAAVAPRVSVIGVGRGNDYGHPSRKALDQLATLGVTVQRTDVGGDVAVCLIGGELHTVARGPVLRSSRQPVTADRGG